MKENGLLIEETKQDGSFNVLWRQLGELNIEAAYKKFEEFLKSCPNHIELWRKAEGNEGPWLLARKRQN